MFIRQVFSIIMLSHSQVPQQQLYFLSVGYTDQEGMIKKNTFVRKNARLNIDHKLNKYISLGANIGYTNGLSKVTNTGSSFSNCRGSTSCFCSSSKPWPL